MDKPFKTLSSQIVWSSPWYRVRQDEIVLPNGRANVYNVVEKSDAVWVVPVTAVGEIVLIYTYRYTVDTWCWEVPAGSIKPGQSAPAAAREELREEVGGTAESLEYLCQFYPANGICDEVGHIYLATGVTLGTPAHEAAEVIQIHPKPIAEVLRMVHAHEIHDGSSALALLLCEQRLRDLISS